MSNELIDRLIRRCAPQEMYDDGGYCETKIKRLGVYYLREVNGGSDTHCSECALQLVLEAIKKGEKFIYKDKWLEDFDLITGRKVVGGKAIYDKSR